MAASSLATLSRNEQAMLDLALLCDLELSPETDRPAIRARHAQIKTPADALVYIRAVEHKVHLRRKVVQLQGRRGQA